MTRMPAGWLSGLCDAVRAGRIEWKLHAVQRMLERSIRPEDVVATLLQGEIVEEYPDDWPCPSCLFLGQGSPRPYHIVAGYDALERTVHIITAYEPDTERFESDWRTRRARP